MTPTTLQIDPPHDATLEYIDTLPNALKSTFSLADISPEIRAKLTLTLPGRVLQHQLNALPRSLSLASVQKNWVLIGGTGTGKAYYMGGLIHELRRNGIDDPNDTVLVVTKASIVIQTYRVLVQEFGLKNIQVVSYDSLRSSLGEMYITWKTQIINDSPRVNPVWCKKEDSGISRILCDECQALKNDDSFASQIIQNAGIAGYPITFLSATPFSRVAHVKTIGMCLAPIVKIGNAKFRLDHNSFPQWIKSITDNPNEWTPADMKRVCKAFEDQLIRFENVRFAHMFKIRQIVIPFESPEHKQIYDAAFAEYQTARLEQGRDALTGFAAVLVALRKFNQKAELLRASYLAKSAYQCVNSKKRPVNAIIACGFLDTIFVVEQCLVKKYGVDPSLIAIIKGGQSAKERQYNIDRFNSEKARYIILSFGAGGAGLSLHHTKNKKYPSEIFLPPVWNSEDLVQVLGRAHRINSESTTYQNLIWFAGTMEENIAERVKGKCAALKEVVGANERWVMAMDNSNELRSSTQVNISQLRDADTEDDDAPVSEELLAACNGNANASVHQLIT